MQFSQLTPPQPPHFCSGVAGGRTEIGRSGASCGATEPVQHSSTHSRAALFCSSTTLSDRARRAAVAASCVNRDSSVGARSRQRAWLPMRRQLAWYRRRCVGAHRHKHGSFADLYPCTLMSPSIRDARADPAATDLRRFSRRCTRCALSRVRALCAHSDSCAFAYCLHTA